VIKRNGVDTSLNENNGYACFHEDWNGENIIEIDFDIKPHFVSANRNVREDAGKIALMKGPCVYCIEEIDNGDNLAAVYTSPDTQLSEGKPVENLFGKLPTI
jgi:DUF1680 family protein